MAMGEGHPERIRVYLVDDHPVTLDGLRVILELPDIEIVGEARTGEAAIKDILRLEPRVVILDIRLPDMDGLAVLRHLKPKLSETSVIIYTAIEDPYYLTSAVAEGAAGFAIKIQDSQDLVSLVRRTASGEECLRRSYWVPLLRELEAKRQGAAGAVQKDWPERDMHILQFMAHGQSNSRIAKLLDLNPGTLQFYIKSIFARLAVSDRTHAVVQAIGKGILAAPGFTE